MTDGLLFEERRILLTDKELKEIRRRIDKVACMSPERKVKEQLRLIKCLLNKAEMRKRVKSTKI